MKPLLKRTAPAQSAASNAAGEGQQAQQPKERESEPLPLKYRPRTLAELAGNEETRETLESIFARKLSDIPHAFLLAGPSGCGKTTIARIIKTMLDVADTNYREFNTANTRGIDTIRDMSSTAKLTGLRKGVKMYLLDECHMLTKEAQNAMLKLLEDAPKHVYFVLATTEPDKLLKTIHTRCTYLTVKPLTVPAMVRHLKRVCEAENANVPPEVLTKIAQVSEGLPREAMKQLDTIIDLKSEETMMNAIVIGTSEDKQVIELCRALIDKSADWKKVSGILANLDAEPENARYAILGYLNAVLLKSGSSRVIQLIKLFEPSFMYSKKAGLTAACACAVKGLVPYSQALIKDGD